MWSPRPTGTQSIFRFGLENTPITIEIEPSKNAKMYSIVLRFNYLEQSRQGYLNDLSENNPLPTTDFMYKYIEPTAIEGGVFSFVKLYISDKKTKTVSKLSQSFTTALQQLYNSFTTDLQQIYTSGFISTQKFTPKVCDSRQIQCY